MLLHSIQQDECSAEVVSEVHERLFYALADCFIACEMNDRFNVVFGENALHVCFAAHIGFVEQERLKVFGNDYPTPDGTCVRDYIHVVDLAKGHLAAVKSVREKKGAIPYNLGTGNGYSVLEIIRTFERVNGLTIPFDIAERRAGDAAECYCVPEKAEKELGWKAERGLEQMCRDAWNYAKNNG